MGKTKTSLTLLGLGIGGIAGYALYQKIQNGGLDSLFPNFKGLFEKEQADKIPDIETVIQQPTFTAPQAEIIVLAENDKLEQIKYQLVLLEADYNANDQDIVNLKNDIIALEARIPQIKAANSAKWTPSVNAQQAAYEKAQSTLDWEINIYNEEVYHLNHPTGAEIFNPLFEASIKEDLAEVQGRINTFTVQRDNAYTYLNDTIAAKNRELSDMLSPVQRELTAKKDILSTRIIAQDEIGKVIDQLKAELH